MQAVKKVTSKKASPKKEASKKVNEFKTRSAIYFKQMSDDVKARLSEKAEQLGVANWVIAEKILENGLGIEKSGIDLNKWLGINANRARTGKPPKGNVTK